MEVLAGEARLADTTVERGPGTSTWVVHTKEVHWKGEEPTAWVVHTREARRQRAVPWEEHRKRRLPLVDWAFRPRIGEEPAWEGAGAFHRTEEPFPADHSQVEEEQSSRLEMKRSEHKEYQLDGL